MNNADLREGDDDDAVIVSFQLVKVVARQLHAKYLCGVIKILFMKGTIFLKLHYSAINTCRKMQLCLCLVIKPLLFLGRKHTKKSSREARA